MQWVASWALGLVLAPGSGQAGQPRARDGQVGPFVVEQSSELTWPGPYVGDFSLAPDRRWVHRFSLGFAARPLRFLRFDVVLVEASSDPIVRRRGLRPPPYPHYNVTGSAWTGLSIDLPRTDWTLTAGQARLPAVPGRSGVPRILPAAGVPKLSLTGRI